MNRKSKKGSALVTVVCLCAVLSILTISLMAATTGGFSLRKDQNKRIENFYSADSGIEIAENKIMIVIEEAIKSGNDVIDFIKLNISSYPDIDITQKGWEQEPFKKEFERYIDENLEKGIDNVQIDNILPAIVPALSTIYDEFERDGKKIKVDAKKGKRYEDGHEIASGGDYSKDREQKWKIKSNFKDKDENEREVLVNYNVKTPDYGKIAGEMVENTGIFDYIMAIDGNLDIYNGGTFKSLGDMWVGGKNQSGDRSTDLLTYDPGIKLQKGTNTKGTFDWSGSIITPKDMMIDNVYLKASNIYSDDLLVKMEGGAPPADFRDKDIILGNGSEGVENPLGEGSLNLYNDLIFDVTNTKIKMENYYGLNDIDSNQNPTDADLTTDKANWGKSSSIIVASEDFGTNSKIEISENMHVMGTAYLQLDGVDYKTGESIAINKYSEPYTQRKINELGSDEYLYKYINPLQVVDKKMVDNEYKNLSVTDKVEIVKEFLKSSDSNFNKVGFSGIDLKGKAYTTGVMYNNGDISKSFEILPECGEDGHSHNIVDCKQKEYTEEVYNMGGKLSNAEAEMYFDEKRTLASVENSFNWNFIKNNIMSKENIKDEVGREIFKRDENLVYPIGEEDKTIAVFKSTMKVGEIIPTLVVENFKDRDINIIFNVSNQNDSIDDSKDLFFEKGLTTISDMGNGEVELPMSLIDNSTTINIIISDGDINIIDNGSAEVRGMFYTTENLNLGSNASMTFGNYAVPKFDQLNVIFKELFGGVIGGVVDGGIIDQGNGETVNNASDLLEQEDWNLIK